MVLGGEGWDTIAATIYTRRLTAVELAKAKSRDESQGAAHIAINVCHGFFRNLEKCVTQRC